MPFEIGVIYIISPCVQMHFPKIERVHLDQHQLTTNSMYTKLSPNKVRSEPKREDKTVKNSGSLIDKQLQIMLVDKF